MKKFLVGSGIIFFGIIFICMVYGEKVQHVKNQNPKVIQQKINSTPAYKPDINFGKIPLYFISNRGQVNKQAKFYAKASRYTLWLTKEGLVFDTTIKEKLRRQKEKGERLKLKTQHSKLKTNINRDVSRLMFLGSNKNPEIVPINETKLKVNFFKGNDPSKWVGNIPTSQAVLYKNLYKNIDLKVYGIEKQIEYDWIVKPGGNPEDIRFEYKNVKSTRIDKEGNLVINTKFGKLMHKKPKSFQQEKNSKLKTQNSKLFSDEGNREINVTFKKINENTFGFEVGEYDKSKDLIIDPLVLLYSTYLGGGLHEYGYGIAVDSSGYVYVTGRTESTDFPCLNQYMSDPGDSSSDVFVTKLDTTQSGTSSLLYSTYLGGGLHEYGYGIAVDNSGNAYVTGTTGSIDFPCLNQYMSDPGDSSSDVFVTKLDTTQSGTSSLLYSTYLGGGSSADRGQGIAVDSSGYVYVTGDTESTDFPTINQYMSDPGDGSADAFVTKLDTTQSGTASLIYSTYLGDALEDIAYGIAVDSSGFAYVTGETASLDFPTLNQYMSDPGDMVSDAFVTKLDTTQSGTSSLVYSTYLGGGSGDEGYGIAVDSLGYAYVTGFTLSSDFPCLNQYMSDPGDSNKDAFVIKLDTTQSGTSSLVYSTYLGGGSGDEGYGIAVDSLGYAYVTGQTISTDFPTLNQYMSDPVDVNWDTFVIKLDTTQSGTSSLLYSTYLGGGFSDIGNGIAVDSSGYVYVTGTTGSTDFPTLFQYMSDPGGFRYEAFVTKLMDYTDPHPFVWTKSVSSITAISAGCGGVVISEGSSAVTHRGVCWSLSPNPTIWDDYTIDGSGLGEYTSQITGLAPETIYYVRAYAVNNDGLDYGEETHVTTLPASITVTSPNGKETWCTGTSQNITWASDGVINTLYIILQQNDHNVALINKGIDPSLGTYAWIVGDCIKGVVNPGVNYKVFLKEKNTTIKDKSDSVFTIVDPYVTVTSPNGGEDWAMSSSQNITWSSDGLTGNLYIILQQNGTNVALIQKNIDPSLGTYAWTVGDCRTGTVTTGLHYKIIIKEKGSTIKDKSDGEFVISE